MKELPIMTPSYDIETDIPQLLAQTPHLKRLGQSRFLYDSQRQPDTVPILSGGGSGHEPAHYGYIGQGMLTGALAGELFVPPTSAEISEAIRFLDQGKGVFIIIKNFAADLAVFQEAIETCRQEGHDIRYVISHDDISVEAQFALRHRGVAGTLFLHKILGQAALEGADLATLEQIGLQLAASIATLGVASKAPSHPVTQIPLFSLQKGYISYGVGIHGEAGYKTVPFTSSEKLAIELINKLRMFFRWKHGQHFAVLINDLGDSSTSSLTTFRQHVLELLTMEGLVVDFVHTGRFMTNLNMEGLSLSLLRLDNPMYQSLLSADTTATAWLASH